MVKLVSKGLKGCSSISDVHWSLSTAGIVIRYKHCGTNRKIAIPRSTRGLMAKYEAGEIMLSVPLEAYRFTYLQEMKEPIDVCCSAALGAEVIQSLGLVVKSFHPRIFVRLVNTRKPTDTTLAETVLKTLVPHDNKERMDMSWDGVPTQPSQDMEDTQAKKVIRGMGVDEDEEGDGEDTTKDQELWQALPVRISGSVVYDREVNKEESGSLLEGIINTWHEDNKYEMMTPTLPGEASLDEIRPPGSSDGYLMEHEQASDLTQENIFDTWKILELTMEVEIWKKRALYAREQLHIWRRCALQDERVLELIKQELEEYTL